MMMTDSRHILYCPGVHDDGDIFNEENLVEFRRFVMEATDNKGVHFVMADGVSKNSRPLRHVFSQNCSGTLKYLSDIL